MFHLWPFKSGAIIAHNSSIRFRNRVQFNQTSVSVIFTVRWQLWTEFANYRKSGADTCGGIFACWVIGSADCSFRYHMAQARSASWLCAHGASSRKCETCSRSVPNLLTQFWDFAVLAPDQMRNRRYSLVTMLILQPYATSNHLMELNII